MKASLAALSLLSVAGPALAATYSISDTVIGSQFYTKFNFQDFDDPTNGRVNYVDRATAQSQNLTYASADTFIMRADYKTVLNPSGPGRNSVRIRSNAQYSTHVAIFNVRHMPQGCGTWPAIWETNEDIWPDGGETDIVEGVNDQGPNDITLHTAAGANCVMPETRSQTGTSLQLECDIGVNGESGCGVQAPTANSYGPAFNANGGGWYAIERTDSFIKVWFWPRNAANVPADVRNGASSVNTGGWGTPTANFPNTKCDLAAHFKAHNIIINLTLCGDWAGSDYPSSCPSTCVDNVNKNPGSFVNAYFDIASVRIYQ